MDVHDIPTLAPEFQTSTESYFIHEYMTTMNLFNIQMVDQVPEMTSGGVDGLFVFYGLGGILIFFLVYMLFYSYILHCKDASEQQEIELRQLNERVSRTSYRHPMNEGRIFIDDFNRSGSASLPMPSLAEGDCTETKPKCLDVEKGRKREDTRIMDLPPIHRRNPQEFPAGKYFPEDKTSNANGTKVPETCGTVGNSENSSTVGRVSSWMSEPPACYSTPQDSKERLFFPEDFQDLLYPNAEKAKEYETSNKRESDADTPAKGEKVTPPVHEGKSNSSPTSPDIVRRRLTNAADTPRRPSSWQ